jgi:hypothetical protein
MTTEPQKARYLYYMRQHRNPSEAGVSLGREVIDKGLSLYKGDLYKNTFAKDPLVHLAIVQQHVISEIRAFISERVGRVSERDQHVISPIATPVRRLTVSLQYPPSRSDSSRVSSVSP